MSFPNSNTNILIVDDDPFIRTLATEVLQRLGYELIETSSNGREALSKIDRSLTPYDIIICDLNMPKMNGIEFLEELRKDAQLADTSVFVMTTSDHQSDVQAAHRHHVAGYIIKPINRDQMLGALETLNLYWSLCEYPANGRH